ncbi:hypothetical protein [Campylobacter coli]|uniref:hypothetical protein n=1 Tax=Campylobacter coli TaxID=195 RepID=UPI001CB76DCD|nr:hypothetical protein [Campylobacter coli]
MTKEKIISYEEVQANPMLKWFFDREIKHSIKDKYYKEWQEYVKKNRFKYNVYHRRSKR